MIVGPVVATFPDVAVSFYHASPMSEPESRPADADPVVVKSGGGVRVDPEPVVDGIFRVAPDGSAVLLGGRCTSCGRLDFPRPVVCAFCRSDDVAEIELGRTGGAVWAWTSVAAAPPGYEGPVPYGFGIVELDEGIRVITRLTEADPSRVTFGDRVRCVADPVGTDDDGTQTVAWAFEPAATDHPLRCGGRNVPEPGTFLPPERGTDADQMGGS